MAKIRVRAPAISLSLLPLLPQPAPGTQGGLELGFGPGQRLAPLELPTIDGQGSLRLSELRGRRLLLIQFASW